jgi:multidrug efflux pump subunit AcrA (membrane-fusion protein)
VAQVDETSSSALGKTEVVIEMEDAAGRWPMGRFVEARLDAGVVEAAVAVPRGALVRAGLGDFLYVADGEFLKRVRVKTAAEDAAWIEIVEGVSSGQNVVTHGAESLWLLELSEVGGMANIK